MQASNFCQYPAWAGLFAEKHMQAHYTDGCSCRCVQASNSRTGEKIPFWWRWKRILKARSSDRWLLDDLQLSCELCFCVSNLRTTSVWLWFGSWPWHCYPLILACLISAYHGCQHPASCWAWPVKCLSMISLRLSSPAYRATLLTTFRSSHQRTELLSPAQYSLSPPPWEFRLASEVLLSL